IGGKRYASEPSDEEMGMRARLSEVLEIGMRFFYEYDYGSTTALVLKVVALLEQGMPKGAVELLARNEAPQVSCQRCSIQPATQICTECAWNGKGWLCEACAVAHECGDDMCLPVVNSPRVGVCGYTGLALLCHGCSEFRRTTMLRRRAPAFRHGGYTSRTKMSCTAANITSFGAQSIAAKFSLAISPNGLRKS